MGALKVFWPDETEHIALRKLLAETGQFDFAADLDEEVVLCHFFLKDAGSLSRAAAEDLPVRILELSSENIPGGRLRRLRLRKICRKATHILLRVDTFESIKETGDIYRMLRGWGCNVRLMGNAAGRGASVGIPTSGVSGDLNSDHPVFMAFADDTVKPVIDAFILLLAEFPDAKLLLLPARELSRQEKERIGFFSQIVLLQDYSGIPADLTAVIIMPGCEEYAQAATLARKPVIAFDDCLISDGDTGMIVDIESRDELLRAFRLMLRQPQTVDFIVRRASRMVQETDEVKMVRYYCALIEKALISEA